MKQIDKAYTYRFWPCGFIQRGAKSILGKRGSQGMQQDMLHKGDEQAEKKAKSWDGSEIVEEVGVSQHPCREQ